ncbi:MAG: peptidoglycan-binding domain-containing protein, partial [Candidatus Binatia bacterium]
VSTVREAGKIPADAFLQELQRVDLGDSVVRATNRLLRIWGVREMQSGEWQKGALDFGAVAQARRLEYYPFRGSFAQLALLDLPAVIELNVPSRRERRFLVLLKVSGDRCRVLLDREYDVPLRVLNAYWFGTSHLFWKDFDSLGHRLSVGSVGENVRRLHALLFSVQALDSAELPLAGQETIFNRRTEKAVTRFQQAKQLNPDGVVGPLTTILLYKSFPAAYAYPSLNTVAGAATPGEGSARREEMRGDPVGMRATAGKEGT